MMIFHHQFCQLIIILQLAGQPNPYSSFFFSNLDIFLIIISSYNTSWDKLMIKELRSQPQLILANSYQKYIDLAFNFFLDIHNHNISFALPIILITIMMISSRKTRALTQVLFTYLPESQQIQVKVIVFKTVKKTLMTYIRDISHFKSDIIGEKNTRADWVQYLNQCQKKVKDKTLLLKMNDQVHKIELTQYNTIKPIIRKGKQYLLQIIYEFDSILFKLKRDTSSLSEENIEKNKIANTKSNIQQNYCIFRGLMTKQLNSFAKKIKLKFLYEIFQIFKFDEYYDVDFQRGIININVLNEKTYFQLKEINKSEESQVFRKIFILQLKKRGKIQYQRKEIKISKLNNNDLSELNSVQQIHRKFEENKINYDIPNIQFISEKSKSINSHRLNMRTMLLPYDREKGKKDLFHYLALSNTIQKEEEKKIQKKDALEKFIRQYYQQQKIQKCEEIIAKQYCLQSFFYPQLNKGLRGLSKISDVMHLRIAFTDLFNYIHKSYGRNRQKICQRLEEGPFTLYRGTYLSEQEIAKLIKYKGSYIELQGFISTTSDQNIIKNFLTNAKFIIHVKQENLKSFIDHGFVDMSESSFFKEKQFLFNAMNIFKIQNVYQEYIQEYKITTIQLEYGKKISEFKAGDEVTENYIYLLEKIDCIESLLDTLRDEGEYQKIQTILKKYMNQIKFKKRILNQSQKLSSQYEWVLQKKIDSCLLNINFTEADVYLHEYNQIVQYKKGRKNQQYVYSKILRLLMKYILEQINFSSFENEKKKIKMENSQFFQKNSNYYKIEKLKIHFQLFNKPLEETKQLQKLKDSSIIQKRGGEKGLEAAWHSHQKQKLFFHQVEMLQKKKYLQKKKKIDPFSKKVLEKIIQKTQNIKNLSQYEQSIQDLQQSMIKILKGKPKNCDFQFLQFLITSFCRCFNYQFFRLQKQIAILIEDINVKQHINMHQLFTEVIYFSLSKPHRAIKLYFLLQKIIQKHKINDQQEKYKAICDQLSLRNYLRVTQRQNIKKSVKKFEEAEKDFCQLYPNIYDNQLKIRNKIIIIQKILSKEKKELADLMKLVEQIQSINSFEILQKITKSALKFVQNLIDNEKFLHNEKKLSKVIKILDKLKFKVDQFQDKYKHIILYKILSINILLCEKIRQVLYPQKLQNSENLLEIQNNLEKYRIQYINSKIIYTQQQQEEQYVQGIQMKIMFDHIVSEIQASLQFNNENQQIIQKVTKKLTLELAIKLVLFLLKEQNYELSIGIFLKTLLLKFKSPPIARLKKLIKVGYQIFQVIQTQEVMEEFLNKMLKARNPDVKRQFLISMGYFFMRCYIKLVQRWPNNTFYSSLKKSKNKNDELTLMYLNTVFFYFRENNQIYKMQNEIKGLKLMLKEVSKQQKYKSYSIDLNSREDELNKSVEMIPYLSLSKINVLISKLHQFSEESCLAKFESIPGFLSSNLPLIILIIQWKNKIIKALDEKQVGNRKKNYKKRICKGFKIKHLIKKVNHIFIF